MFDRIKKAFFQDAKEPLEPQSADPQLSEDGPASEWASTQGFAFSAEGSGRGMALEGEVGGKPWRLQLGQPTRDFILGAEVRARAELDVREDVAVLVMNRPLKESLEQRAHQIYADQPRTAADTSMPEEMRCLSMLDETGWETLPPDFWTRYSVLTDRREDAIAWVDPALARLMMAWPSPATKPEVPFMLLLLRGKAYLRMEYSPADLSTLQHAALIFTSACEAALLGFGSTAAGADRAL